ncbi:MULTISPECIES: hypothetical protein [unclassified Campylobacter]|uniref:hypothetical protein n=1 Tax=unclassified Campylobacter TaxID=2593542 RepID=UPI0022E9E60F|nr:MULTISPECIES: hypothetical protein [unclassified Campylobacter]MDA3043375.1 hypothetical protein [Campylobacter sp. JMF_09 ED2]MDA3045128.1 hypothetical protein [Campylobacter sp. JMF_07 ED4]MDA3064272.1 hypothetical protein [Campylobacter sp. JMF_11 EL3]MDA3072428.1 hypothetical protein [Campylobacter sp. VBCF_03 NA9]MDA3075460.1 hypothetical protein [Campylobacter sp. JMF_05 ED3]
MKNLWILTEERPKVEVLEIIIQYFAKNQNIGFISSGSLKIIPVLENNKFSFCYEVIGINTPKINKIFIKIVSGQSSFVDFLIYFQEKQPIFKDIPLYAIEETKTDDSESRNTGIYQRCSKFIYIDYFYPNIKKIMLYSLQIQQKEKPTQTNIFGSRLLTTYGVEIIGKIQNKEQTKPFYSIDELIEYKNKMKKPPKNNIPIIITKKENKIQISGRLIKANRLSHDPNIGALSIISAVLRKLNWKHRIVITMHGLKQKHLLSENKFIQIANRLNIELQGLTIQNIRTKKQYWHYEEQGEKLATIFIHLVIENFTHGYSIFENHAGCEKGYFHNSDGSVIPLQKYSNREEYKDGNKSAIIHIPDLILLDIKNLEIINIEGKKFQNKKYGILELNNYDDIENFYIKLQYPKYKIIRTVVLYGGILDNNKTLEIEIGFVLTKYGKMILGIKAPKIFNLAIKNLLDYWKN